MWNEYLKSFPIKYNGIYRVRREHDCGACRQFIKNVGAIVTIIDGNVKSIWDLSVRELDGIFKILNAKVKQASEESLLTVRSAADTDTHIMIDIVKHIVDVKLAEQAARELAADKRAKKQRIMEIMSQKQDVDLQNKSMDELEALLKEMGD